MLELCIGLFNYLNQRFDAHGLCLLLFSSPKKQPNQIKSHFDCSKKAKFSPIFNHSKNYQIEFEAIWDEGVQNKIILSPKLCPISTSWSYLFSCAHHIFKKMLDRIKGGYHIVATKKMEVVGIL
jgi:hypothetical protein